MVSYVIAITVKFIYFRELNIMQCYDNLKKKKEQSLNTKDKRKNRKKRHKKKNLSYDD